jgi:hypothetical protein
VIGDSFIEGLMNPYRDMLHGRLAGNLGLPLNEEAIAK